MLLELTDLLACPQCGPEQSLVLLVTEAGEGRVRTGWLGCPNCRRDFPVNDGVADLRLDTEDREGGTEPLRDDELPLKIVALSGLTQERGFLVVDEHLAAAAHQIAEIAPEVEVIAVSPEAPSGATDSGLRRVGPPGLPGTAGSGASRQDVVGSETPTTRPQTRPPQR